MLGPLIDVALADSVRDACNASHHNYEVVVSPPDLLEYMRWCDVAIATSGLTKYELAASGTPAIIFSIDNEHHEAKGIQLQVDRDRFRCWRRSRAFE